MIRKPAERQWGNHPSPALPVLELHPQEVSNGARGLPVPPAERVAEQHNVRAKKVLRYLNPGVQQLL